MAGENASNFPQTGIAVPVGKLYLYDDTETDIDEQTRVAVTATAAELNQLDGLSTSLSGLTASTTEINAVADLSANGAVIKTVKIPITRVASTSEQDTGVNVPAKAVVLDCYVDVVTAEATGTTKTVDVGLLASESGGDADGFLDGVSVAATGVKIGSLVAGSVTLGLLFRETLTDSNTETVVARKPHNAQSVTARSISYTLGSNNFAELVANIIITYIEVA